MSSTPLVIRPLTQVSVPDAARLLAASMRDNPLHERVFVGAGPGLEPLLAQAFARLLHRQLRVGHVFGAWEGERLPGAPDVCVTCPADSCGAAGTCLPRS